MRPEQPIKLAAVRASATPDTGLWSAYSKVNRFAAGTLRFPIGRLLDGNRHHSFES